MEKGIVILHVIKDISLSALKSKIAQQYLKNQFQICFL